MATVLVTTRHTFPNAPSGRYDIESTEASVDVAATGDQAEATDTEDADLCCVSVKLLTLTGGASPSLDFRVQHSPDNVLWFDAGMLGPTFTAAAMSATQSYSGLSRYVQVAWVTKGTPATATATIFVTAKRR